MRKLAAIVRIADGLDRTHDARVRGVAFRNSKKGIELKVESGKDLELELWAVRQKAALFKEAFGVELTFRGREKRKKSP